MDEPTKNSAKVDWAARRKAIQPKAINLLQEELVSTELLAPGQTLPLVIKPVVGGVNLAAWAARHREFIKTNCSKHGAILFRDFGINTVEEFEQVIEAISGKVMEYRERSSPRSSVGGNIYTSTDYPADQSIFPHNEHSYARTLPLKLYFCCLTPPEQGGQTPIADTRKIFQRLSAQTRERFIEKKWMYVRNFGDGFGLHWHTVFQTTDKQAVEQYCRQVGIEYEWRDDDRLRTRQIRPAFAQHPHTGEHVWFNHATFFHVSTLEPSIREALLAEFKTEDLPNNTYYGDGSEIEPAVLDELRAAYLQESVAFDWERGDLIVLDNMLTAHARRPFVGARKIVFGMAEPFTRTDF
jgi:alpha-ketoglutarate-dependent taurine dioxygenase